MGKTLKDLTEHENHRIAALRAKLERALAHEKAKREVFGAMLSGKLQARQLDGDTWRGKVNGMERSVAFSLSKLIDLRSEQLS